MTGIFGLFLTVFECVLGLGKYAWIFLWSFFRSRSGAAARIVALESQLDVCLRRSEPKRARRFSDAYRLLWVILSKFWDGWERVCHVMKSRTVVGWQQKVFQLFWKRKSRGEAGRKPIVLALRRMIRRIRHWAVTECPSLNWIIQQLREATAFGEVPRYLHRDNEGLYGKRVRQFLKDSCVKEVRCAYRWPWQNPYCERFFGSLQKELLHHVIILHEPHLRNLLGEYVIWYENFRLHQGLGGKCPVPPTDGNRNATGKIVSIPILGGLHHRYERVAA